MKTILEPPHLLLRKLDFGDLDFVAEMLIHPEAMRYWLRCPTRCEAEEWIWRRRGGLGRSSRARDKHADAANDQAR
jgi:RimJ/RimL family protein N-acetyltransferase